MKNIHVLPTPNPSRLMIDTIENKLYLQPILHDKTVNVLTHNIYITSDEQIKEGDWCMSLCDDESYEDIYQCKNIGLVDDEDKKIILTTDQDLIKDGVQAIDDEFLQWFVNNPSCESVEVLKYKSNNMRKMNLGYKIILPKEEPKTAWVGVLHDKLNEYYPAEYELKDIYQGEGCLPNFPNEELCQIWCDSKYKEEPNYNMKQEILDEMKKQETLEEAAERLYPEEWDWREREIFIKGAKWQMDKQDEFTLGFLHWYNTSQECETYLRRNYPKNITMNGEHYKKVLEINKELLEMYKKTL
jgi:hypothetical protein